MKSKQEQLEKRGYLADEFAFQIDNVSFDEKIRLLESKIPTERTLGARLLKDIKTKKSVECLIEALKKEKKLYTKIEICNSLSGQNEVAISPLINCLGKIGNNQHRFVPEKEFKKDNYPLPRDIASRTLIRIGEKAIPKLLKGLEVENEIFLSELIDTIGYINFYGKIKDIYEPLKKSYHRYAPNDLIKWKIIRALSGLKESENFLKEQFKFLKNKRLKKEVERSLRILKKK